MDIEEHKLKVQERLKLIGSWTASVTLEEGSIVYATTNDCLSMPVPQEDITIKE